MDTEDKTLSAAEQQLLDALDDLTESISFCASDTRPLVLPGLIVDDVGEITFPISKTNARQLIKQSSQAPYGRGEETIVDTEVRQVWQLEPDQFRLENPKWQSFVDDVVDTVKYEFGIKQKVTASLYKLLAYEKGSFFVPHRDTEKAHRMFATLVICLPSKHEGGQLIVSHAGESQEVDFSGKASSYELQYAAFYADCQHEVRPVTDGYRICLVYNLATSGRKKQPVAPEFSDSVEWATKSMEVIFEEDDERDMVVLPLAHQYTEAGLAPDTSADRSTEDDDWEENDLEDEDWDEDEDDGVDESVQDSAENYSGPLEFKGADRARVDVLAQVAARANYRAFVALLTHWQSGYPDYGTIDYEPYGRYGGYGYQDVSDENTRAEFEEVFEESISLKHWHALDGTRQPFDELAIDESDIVIDFDNEERPYRQEVHEATGNAGMSMERWYHQAVVVLWPDARHFHVLASQGTKNSVPALEELVTATKDPTKCKECRSFAKSIIDYWQYSSDARRGKTNSLGTSMMRSLLAIGDDKLAQKFLRQVLPLEYRLLDGGALLALAELANWDSIEKPLISFFRSQKPGDYRTSLRGLATTFGSLASLGDSISKNRKQACKSVLKEVFAVLERWEKTRPDPMCEDSVYGRDFEHTKSRDFVGVVEPLVHGICAVGTRSDLKQLLTRIAANPKHYDLHDVLIPAVNSLLTNDRFVDSNKLAAVALEQLRQFCIDELSQRTIKEPKPPKDWQRKAKLDCDCADCQELAQFLKNKDTQVHRFSRRKDLRQHLHRQIDHHRIDCAHVTERRGRPFTLVCTKNQATYERERQQYQTDCKLLKELSKR